MRDFLLSINRTDLFQSRDGRGKAAMNTQKCIVDEGPKAEVVKDFATVLPYVDGAVLFETFVIETVNLRNLPAFMVASNQRNPIRVPHLQKNASYL